MAYNEQVYGQSPVPWDIFRSGLRLKSYLATDPVLFGPVIGRV